MKKSLALAIALAAGMLCGSVSAQEAYPNKPIKIIVPLAPGGSTDVAARVIAEALQRELGQPVIVENKAGASGTIGAGFVAKAPADGYTILIGTGSTHVVAPATLKNTPYDPLADFTPIGLVGRAPFLFFAGPSMLANSLADILALARAQPGVVSFGTTGPAATYELAALTLEALGNVKFNHVPYKGFAPLVIDLAGGVLDVAVGPVDSTTLNSRIRSIATLGAKRITSRPNTPSAAEAGYPAFNVPVWAAIYGPPGLPRPIAAKLIGALRVALAQPQVQARIGGVGINVDWGDDAALQKVMADDLATVRQLMKSANVEPQ